jgi:mono/diheme cytochrome c family protein
LFKKILTCLIAISLLILTGCGKEKCPNEPSSDPSLASDIQPIFNKSCAFANCHDASAQAALDLSAGKARTNLVNVPATLDPSKVRLIPNQADSSYLVFMIVPQSNGKSQMPIGGNPLSDNEIQLIKNWIDAGAKNN